MKYAKIEGKCSDEDQGFYPLLLKQFAKKFEKYLLPPN
jgi:hypothetical protein